MHIIRGEKNSNIESIEFLDEEIEMCEITIDSDEHSYYLNGVLTHNCAEELRLAAGLSKEPVLYNAFKTGQDPHKMTAIKMFGEDNYNKDRRKDAKISNFGLLYDGNEYTLASATGKDIEECRILYKQYWKTMSTLKMWKRQQVTKCYQNGGVCYTAYGRPRRLLYYLNHPLDKMRSFGERSVCSHIIQGTGGDIMRMTLIKLYKSLFIPYAKDSGFIGCVHDEIVFWVNKDIVLDVVHQVQDIMEVTVPTSDIKLETSVEVGNSYGYTFPFKWENGILVPKVA